MNVKPKIRGFKLQMVTRKGKSGARYLFFKAPNGSYHAFVEVETKSAARDCGATSDNARQMCRQICGF